MQSAQHTQCWIDETGSVSCSSDAASSTLAASGAPVDPPQRALEESRGEPVTIGARAYDVGPGDGAPYLPPCSVELGRFTSSDGTFNARILCDDPTDDAHGRLVNVEVSTDGTEAKVTLARGGEEFDYLVPVCVVEDSELNIECALKGGRLWCPEHPEFHGATPHALERMTNAVLQRCPDAPLFDLPPGCCAQLGEQGAMLVCPDPTSPVHGLVVPADRFTCESVGGRHLCRIRLDGAAHAVMDLPVCDSPPVALPAGCCYDVARGSLSCPTDPSSSWNGTPVALLDLRFEARGVVAVIAHGLLAEQVAVPICSGGGDATPCCFVQLDGAVGRLSCEPSSPLHGVEAVVLARSPAGDRVLAAWDGGASLLPVCDGGSPGGVDVFCCVNVDSGTFVCPGHAALHGTRADVQTVVDSQDGAYVVLHDGSSVRACGSSIPAPCPCAACPPVAPALPCCSDELGEVERRSR